MKIYFLYEEGIVPEIILAKLAQSILENHMNYLGAKIQDEKVDTEEVLYRLIFEPFIDPTFIWVKILDCIEFKKN